MDAILDLCSPVVEARVRTNWMIGLGYATLSLYAQAIIATLDSAALEMAASATLMLAHPSRATAASMTAHRNQNSFGG